MGAVFRSLSRTFSRHGKMKASFLLLIWLNEKVQKITFAENLQFIKLNLGLQKKVCQTHV